MEKDIMNIWKREHNIEELHSFRRGNLAETLDIHLLEKGPDYLKASMPVLDKHKQFFGILHGGASVVLAETVGSVAAWLCTEGNVGSVGLDINANHIRSVKSGMVYATARPVHIGRSTQVWQIEIKTEDDKMVCISRLTMANIDTEK